MPQLILQIAIPSPLRDHFDYLLPENLVATNIKPGTRVLVPFGTRTVVGILLAISRETKIDAAKLKPITAFLDESPVLSKQVLDLCQWTSNYYHHPLGDVFANALPKLLRTGKKIPSVSATKSELLPTDKIFLNSEQQIAVTKILTAKGFNTFLLDGVTGSGKTEVYLQVIEALLQQGKQALILVPEIGLTPQTIQRFQQRFQLPIAVMHSKMTDRERLNSWCLAKENLAPIVIGTRSAIFTPMPQLGIIILDEEHDLSFKQQAGLRYSAKNLAVIRGKQENIPVILGSATPSLESIYNAERGQYQRLVLQTRAGEASHPSFHLIDMRAQRQTEGLSLKLLQEMEKHLVNKGQILVFLNRRGYAPSLLCHHCGWTAECTRCDAKMTLHQKPKYLHCHYCGATNPVPKICPKCQANDLAAVGLGTERLEEALKNKFPDTTMVRIDRDSTRGKGTMQQMLSDITANNYQILLGTQMLAKGHHFPEVTMAAILNIDGGLLSSDFRASEQMAQLLIQVSGRAGRASKPGEVYIQTYNPEHPLLISLIKDGYYNFALNSLTERKAAKLPPYAYLALVRAEAKKSELATDFLSKIQKHLQPKTNNHTKILGPIPAPLQRKANFYRTQLLVYSTVRSELHELLRQLIIAINGIAPSNTIRWSLDVDPADES